MVKATKPDNGRAGFRPGDRLRLRLLTACRAWSLRDCKWRQEDRAASWASEKPLKGLQWARRAEGACPVGCRRCCLGRHWRAFSGAAQTPAKRPLPIPTGQGSRQEKTDGALRPKTAWKGGMKPPRQEEDVLWRKIRGQLGDMVVGGVPGHCPGVRQSPGARNRERDRGSRQTGVQTRAPDCKGT